MTRQSRSPIAVFAFNRPDHLRRTLLSLKACVGFEAADVTVFCDGPRSDAELAAVQAVRVVAKEELGSEADYRFAETNSGLAQSIISGVSELCTAHGRVIVIEDDFDLSPGFLTFINASLDAFANEPNVYQISGHMFDVPEFADRADALFLPLTTTWGWATWQRAWSQFDLEATGWQELSLDRSMRRRFNLGGVYDYATMLQRQMAGKRDSWGVRWYWNVFKVGGLVLFPPQSLVRNIGQDGSGSHGAGLFRDFSSSTNPLTPALIGLPTSVSNYFGDDLKHVQKAIWRQNGGWRGKAVDSVKMLLRR